jgi:hypothetical protein
LKQQVLQPGSRGRVIVDESEQPQQQLQKPRRRQCQRTSCRRHTCQDAAGSLQSNVFVGREVSIFVVVVVVVVDVVVIAVCRRRR